MDVREFDSLQHEAEAGDACTMFLLALAFKEGDGTKPDSEKFLEWIEKAAKLGNTSAMFELALAYRDGDGVEPNGDQFFLWIRKAAEQKNAEAMRELAVADGRQLDFPRIDSLKILLC